MKYFMKAYTTIELFKKKGHEEAQLDPLSNLSYNFLYDKSNS